MIDDAEPVRPSPSGVASGPLRTPAGEYDEADQLTGPDGPRMVDSQFGSYLEVMRPATQRVFDYLEGLQSGLAQRGREQGWRVAEGSGLPHGPYLLVPDRASEDRSVVRGYRLQNVSEDTLPGARPYQTRPWVDRGAPGWTDLPAPNIPGMLNRKVVWVSSDPADALLLNSFRLTAVSLADPCETFGSEEMMRRLVKRRVFDPAKPLRRTVVVIDPLAPLSDEWGGYLRGLFEQVWVVRPQAEDDAASGGDEEGPLSLTGQGLARLIGTCAFPSSDPVNDVEALLLTRVAKVGLSCRATPVRLDRDVAPTRTGTQAPSVPPAVPFGTDGLSPTPVRARTAFERSVAGHEVGDWLLKPFLQPGRFTDIQGDTQIGKSTFLLTLTAAVADGADFLGESSDPTDVVYVTEQSNGEFLDNLGTSKHAHPRVHVLTSDDYLGMSFPALVALVDTLRRKHEARLVVFDTVFMIVQMTGGQTSSPQRINELFTTLRPLTASGAAVLLVRHGIDEGGSLSKTGKGPQVYNGRVSTSVRFRTVRYHDFRRKLEVKSRRLGQFDLTVDWSPAGIYTKTPSSAPTGEETSGEDAVDLNDLDRAVLKVLDGINPPGLMSKEIVARLADEKGRGPQRTATDESLARLVGKGLVALTKLKNGRLTHRYALAKP